MRITGIDIIKFRNLHDFHVDLSPGVNLFYGENGHGKTNLLESAAIAINGRTPRTGSIHEIIPHDGKFAKWQIKIDIENVHHDVECTVETGQMKKLLVDGQPKRKIPDTERGAWALTFFPEDFRILTGEPFYRRKFLDEAILLTEPGYAHLMKDYHDAFAARNMMLKTSDRNASNFEPYEEILSKLGLEITSRRAKAIEELEHQLEILTQNIFEKEISIKLCYKPSLCDFIQSDDPLLKLRQEYREKRPRDIAAKRTLTGPHRDDVLALFGDEDIRKFSSRGETRLSVVALIIAKYYMLRQRWDLNPVILLDDIFSELDQSRRQMVLKALPRECQLMITAVDKDLSRKWLSDSGNITIFNVYDGCVTPDPDDII